MSSAYYEVLSQIHNILYCIFALQSSYSYMYIQSAHSSQFPIPTICLSHQVWQADDKFYNPEETSTVILSIKVDVGLNINHLMKVEYGVEKGIKTAGCTVL